jgi:hypothetical protein
MHFTGSRLSVLLAALLLTACAGPSKREPAPDVPQVTAETPFAQLQTIFLAKFPGSGRLLGWDSYLPTTALAFNDLNKANWAAQEDFATWCRLRAGTLNTQPWRADSSADVKAAVKAASDMVYAATHRYNGEDETVCSVQGRPYVLHSKQQTLGPVGGAFTRAIAWISADDLAKLGPLALQAKEAEKKQAREQEARNAATERAKEEAAEANRTSMLERSPKGTQVACGGHLYADTPLTSMALMCNGVGVFYADLAKSGWRVVSQHITPQSINGVAQGSQVDLVAEKVR